MGERDKAEAMLLKVTQDAGCAFTIALAYVGHRLGLFQAMSGEVPLTSPELAARTNLDERYVREWAKAMAAAKYVDCEPGTGRYRLTEDQAAVLAVYGVPRLLEDFKTDGEIPYADIGDALNGAIESYFRTGDRNRLSHDWFAAVPGLTDRLTAGAQVADVGCGGGQSTVRMGEAFSNSVILGVDNDEKKLRRARALAASKGLTNVQFLQIPAERILRDRKFDLVCAFDSFHDMVDPKRLLEAIRASLADDGVFLWAEIGENRARALAREAGFSRFERAATEDPFKQFFLLEK